MVRMEKVVKRFGDFIALKDIDVSVSEGEVVVIIGPSGSGKSTLLRTINQLERHDSGRIIVDGTELTDDMRTLAKIRAETGMVFQQFNLFPHLTVMRNITLAPQKVRHMPLREAEEQALQLLERVGIPEQADKFPGQLSGGQQQRVAIARGAGDEPEADDVRRADVRAGPGDDQRGPEGHGRAGGVRNDDDLRDARDGLRAERGGPGDLHG